MYKEQMTKIMAMFRETENSFLLGDNLSNEETFFEDNFTLDKVFGSAIIEKAKVNELSWYHGIDSWESYSGFIASGNKIERPTHILTKKTMNRLWFTGEAK